MSISTIVDAAVATVAVIAAVLAVRSVIRARTLAARLLEILLALVLVVAVLTAWAVWGHRPMRMIFCRLGASAAFCPQSGRSGPDSRNAASATGLTLRDYDTAEDSMPLLKRALAAEPFGKIEAAANAGDGEALYLTAIAKWRGIATKPDAAAARNEMRRAAATGFKRAIMAYGVMLDAGVGGPRDTGEAVSWWKTGAEANCIPCEVELGHYYAYEAPAPDFHAARGHFERAAAAGNVAAMDELAILAMSGRGQPADQAAASKLYEKAAAGGSARAMDMIAQDYRDGVNYPRDKAKALALFRKAAALGNGDAAVAAADMLSNGDGVAKDLNAAAALLSEASDSGNWLASVRLALLLIDRKIAAMPGKDPEAMAVDGDLHGYPDALYALTSDLRLGRNGWPKDLAHAAALARPALDRASKRPIGEEGAYPLWQKLFSDALEQALLDGAAPQSHPGEIAELERRFGVFSKPIKVFTVPVKCNGAAQPFSLYIWDAPDAPVPTDAQMEWAEKARRCVMPPDVRTSFEKLFDIAKRNHVSFSDLAVEALDKVQKAKGAANAAK